MALFGHHRTRPFGNGRSRLYEWSRFTATTRIDPKFGMQFICTEKNHKPRSNQESNRGLFIENCACLGLSVNPKEPPAYQKNRTPQCSSSAGGYSLTPKFKSETTRLGATLFTIKQKLPAAGLRRLYRHGGARSAHSPQT